MARMFGRRRVPWLAGLAPSLSLTNGSRVAVMGGGPAGSFFSYFLLGLAERVGLDIHVDVYEPRDFTRTGPPGCNMCGGIISESLVQNLATEGINLPPSVVQRGIDSYVLHTDVGRVRIDTPLQEMRIGAVHRGQGPKGLTEAKWESFDGFLQNLAAARGAHMVRGAVAEVRWKDGRPLIKTKDGTAQECDLLAVASGINSVAGKLFRELGIGYHPPRTTKTAIREFYLGEAVVEEYLGSSMHVFLLDIPRLEFAALIPKGDYVSACLLGEEIDAPLVEAFLNSPETRSCFPPGWLLDQPSCQCWPNISVRGAVQPFTDRIVFVGDCGVTRLYKDGIGAAYRTAKAAAATAVLHGVSGQDFQRHYWPTLRNIERDNAIGRGVFAVTRLIQSWRFMRRALIRMVLREQGKDARRRRMSAILWDLFTGSAPYREALVRGIHPVFVGRLLWHTARSAWPAAGGVKGAEVA